MKKGPIKKINMPVLTTRKLSWIDKFWIAMSLLQSKVKDGAIKDILHVRQSTLDLWKRKAIENKQLSLLVFKKN